MRYDGVPPATATGAGAGAGAGDLCTRDRWVWRRAERKVGALVMVLDSAEGGIVVVPCDQDSLPRVCRSRHGRRDLLELRKRALPDYRHVGSGLE